MADFEKLKEKIIEAATKNDKLNKEFIEKLKELYSFNPNRNWGLHEQKMKEFVFEEEGEKYYNLFGALIYYFGAED